MPLNLHNFKNLVTEEVVRVRTGFSRLDYVYGIDKVYNNAGREVMWNIGPPRGHVSLWAGSGGVGKSRTCLSVCISMANLGYNPLYILNEDDPGNLASWIKTKNIPNNIRVLGSDKRDQHEDAIQYIRPDIVVVDSLTGMEGIISSNVIREVMKFYKKLAKDYNLHLILIAHLNKKNEVKGNSDVIYYPDHVCILKHMDFKGMSDEIVTRYKNKGYFLMKFKKNRGGLSGHLLCFQHTDSGVELRTSNIIGYNDQENNI